MDFREMTPVHIPLEKRTSGSHLAPLRDISKLVRISRKVDLGEGRREVAEVSVFMG